MRADDRNQIET